MVTRSLGHRKALSLKSNFGSAALDSTKSKPRKQPKRRNSPFSIRLTARERERLEGEAKGTPLGTYIKAKALGDERVARRNTGFAVEDRQALAKVLALLGRSHIANNLNQLAHAANIGTLPMTAETEEDLRETIRAVHSIRTLLLRALGMREAGP